MDIALKLNILDRIYAIYDQFAASLDLACKKYCDHCCTADLILTTLEGYKIIERLSPDTNTEVIQRIRDASEIKRLRPKLTTNRLAQLCARGVDPPQEADNLDQQICPLLQDHRCPIYELRPYGCRCLVSRHNCGEKGYAEIDDFVLSVNTVFLQTIEHVDAGGCSGNLVDVLQALSAENNRKAYCSSALHCSANRLIPNQPLEVLMIPPEHRSRMEPILQELRGIKVYTLLESVIE
jgi:Fe-S-cluster containining protein